MAQTPNRTKFTQLAVDRLAPPATGRDTYWDATTPGFGLRIYAPLPGKEARRTWIAMGRVDGKAVMVTLDTMAKVPKVGHARELARKAFQKMGAGTRPLEEKRTEEAQRAAKKAAKEVAEKRVAEGKFSVVAERFLREYGRQAMGWRPKYAAEVERILHHDVLPRWGERDVRDITKHDVNELLDAKARSRERSRKGSTGGAAAQANRVLIRLRTLFAWAATADLVDGDPTRGVLVRIKEKPRDRVLDDEEIVWFWRAAERANWPYGPIVKLLLLTAQRENEVAGMRWSELDLDKAVWTIPAARMKMGKAHIVHLSAPAVEILAAMPRIGGSGLVFPTETGRTVGSYSRAKNRIDALMAAQKGTDVEPWVLHDLRRSACTILAERLAIAPHIADKILAHSGGTIRGVAAVYNRAAYLDERKAALEALGRYVIGLVRPGASNVVPLRA